MIDLGTLLISTKTMQLGCQCYSTASLTSLYSLIAFRRSAAGSKLDESVVSLDEGVDPVAAVDRARAGMRIDVIAAPYRWLAMDAIDMA